MGEVTEPIWVVFLSCNVIFFSEISWSCMLLLFLQKGPNKTPVAAICLTSLVTMAFVLVGQVNVLAPIVTINFMLTYITVDYSYFSLSMGGCSLSERPELVPGEGLGTLHCSEPLLLEKAPSYGSEGIAQGSSEGTLLEFTKDMDQLLQLTRKLESSQPRGGESHGILENQKGKTKKASKQTLQESFLLDLRSPASFSPGDTDGWPTASWEGQGPHGNAQSPRSEGDQPRGAYGAKLIPEPSNQPRPSREGGCFAVTPGPPNLGVITSLFQILRSFYSWV